MNASHILFFFFVLHNPITSLCLPHHFVISSRQITTLWYHVTSSSHVIRSSHIFRSNQARSWHLDASSDQIMPQHKIKSGYVIIQCHLVMSSYNVILWCHYAHHQVTSSDEKQATSWYQTTSSDQGMTSLQNQTTSSD